ncbi:MAG: hydroxyacylglutathione hydrolase [Chlorobium sp.]|uniref:hydroxyacylglutathione hydrolase family protein n=1 Tax=Chlorobium sp. TaxID=1095 RepID=UPI0025BDDF49|nr:hydroxyacylglutathione hydrolase family protein [Chlorobium sp.]MCF8383231.1 hydroxyacylglutathione hydrolase [Chlorobium sp.]
MIVKQFRTGGDRNFGYLAADEHSGEALVVDASWDPGSIAEYAVQEGYRIRYVFSTHAHADHTNGNAAMARLSGLKPLLYGDTCPFTGIRVEDGAVFPLGSLHVHILHTPGHTPDSICLHAGDSLFTGDTLFTGKVGGTCSGEEAAAEYDSLQRLLKELPPATMVYPGHDYGERPITTLGDEKRTNPFLLQPDFNAFLALKNNWAAYKKEHGIK